MGTYCVTCKKILRTKIQVSEELNKIDERVYQIMQLVVRKSHDSLNIMKLVD